MMLSPDAPVWMVAAIVGVLFLAMMLAVYLVLSRWAAGKARAAIAARCGNISGCRISIAPCPRCRK